MFCGLESCWWWGLYWRCAVVVMAECLHLLKLIGRENGGELLLGLLMNGLSLLIEDHGRDGSVGFERVHLLIAVGEDGFNLRGLIGCEAESPAQLSGFMMRIMGVLTGLWRGCRGLPLALARWRECR
jgi:hypothetical protein